MGFPSRLVTTLFTLALVSLSSIGCEGRLRSLLHAASRRRPSSQLYDAMPETAGSLYWKVLSSPLGGEAKEEIREFMDALHQLESRVEDNQTLEKETFEGLSQWSQEEDTEDDHVMQERHPADELLRRHKADATFSYILGGY